MRKILTILAREYWQQVKNWGFLLMLLTPVTLALFALFFGGIAFFAGGGTHLMREWKSRSTEKTGPAEMPASEVVGIIDRAKILKVEEVEKIRPSYVKIIFFKDEEGARELLRKSSLDSLYIIPEDYPNSAVVECYLPPKEKSEEKPEVSLWREIEKELESSFAPCSHSEVVAHLLVFSLTRDLKDSTIRNRILHPMDLKTQTLESVPKSKEEDANGFTKKIFQKTGSMVFAFLFSFFFFMNLLLTSSLMFHAFTQEKNSRLLEMLLSIVSPFQFVVGKLLGFLGVGFTLLAGWFLLFSPIILLSAHLTRRFFDINPFSSGDFITGLLAYILGFLFLGSQMLAIATFGETERETNQYLVWIIFPTILPFMFIQFSVLNPEGWWIRFLSYFPYSAPLGIVVRFNLHAISPGETLLCFLVLALFTTLSVWLSYKILRVNMLMYGQRFHLKTLWKSLRS
ncbi:MAG: ABC transporter permease [bacterium]